MSSLGGQIAAMLPARLTPSFATPTLDAEQAAAHVAEGREALLARDFAGARRAFTALQRQADAQVRHDGEVGLAMLTLATLPQADTLQTPPQASDAPAGASRRNGAPGTANAAAASPSTTASPSPSPSPSASPAPSSPAASPPLSGRPAAPNGHVTPPPALPVAVATNGDRAADHVSDREGAASTEETANAPRDVHEDDASEDAPTDAATEGSDAGARLDAATEATTQAPTEAATDAPDGRDAGAAVPAPRPSDAFDRALALLRGPAATPQHDSDMVRLGRLAAALQAGSLDDIWFAAAQAPSGAEATLASAHYFLASGRPADARIALETAMGPTYTLGAQLGQAVTLNFPAANDAPPSAGTQAIWLAAGLLAQRLAGTAAPFPRGDNALKLLQARAPHGFAAAYAQLAGAAGAPQGAAHRAMVARWPQAAEVAHWGVRLGLVDADARGALLASRPDDVALLQAEEARASGAEAWHEVRATLRRLQRLRPSANQAGMLAWLAQRLGEGREAVHHAVAQALLLQVDQPQALMTQARLAIADKQVDEALVAQLRRLATSGAPEARLLEALALQTQERHDEALAALDAFLVPQNAASGHFDAALLMRAEHHLYERSNVPLAHEAACAAVRAAHADLARIRPGHPAYAKAIRLQPLLARRNEQVTAGIRYRIDERQVRQELADGHLARVRANLEHHARDVENLESELYWLLRALLFKAMGPGNYAKATHAAENAVDLALMRDHLNPEAEALLRELQESNEGAVRRLLSFLNSLLSWFTGLGFGK